MNLSVMPNCNSRKNINQVTFKSAYAEVNGVWKEVSKGGNIVSANKALPQEHTLLELSGVGTKIVDYLPSKAYMLKQKLALTAEDAKEFKKLVETKSDDLRLFLNKFFVGEEFRFTDSKKLYIDNITPPKRAEKPTELKIEPAYKLNQTA